ncbi:MAG: hypothetical protein FWD46_04390 [Cystobacterineae bacterium]|nr:hypothetical protein [Cystobacterineae bacterium]
MHIQVKRSCSERRHGPTFGLLLALAMTSVGCPSEKTVGIQNVDEQEENIKIKNKEGENKEIGNKEEENKEEENKEVEVASMVQGMVLDSSGKVLKDVRVTSGTVSVTTDDAGKFMIEEAAVVNGRSVIKFEKSGYFTLTRSGVKQEESYIRVMLHPKGAGNISLKRTFDARNPTNLSIRPSGATNAMQVNLRALALARADGSDYTGMVTADMVYLDPNNGNFAELMPGGDLAAIDSSGNEGMLISYGMIDVNFSDDEGNPLQLKNGSPAEMIFPLPADMENDPPTSIPLWHFDEEQGIWLEEGSAQRVAGANGTYVYQGEAKHFSWWNLDIYAGTATVTGKVVDCNGEPVISTKVSGHAIATEARTGKTQETMTAAQIIQSASVYTNKDGNYTLRIPIWHNYVGADLFYTAKISVMTLSGTVTLPEIGVKEAESFVNPDIQVPCSTETSGGDEGAFFDTDKGSVAYSIYTGYSYYRPTTIVTFDNNGDRIRLDFPWRYPDADGLTIIHNTIIKDGNRCFEFYYRSWGWEDRSLDIDCHNTALAYMEMAKASAYGVFETSCAVEPICSMTSHIQIAGKSCPFYTLEIGPTGISIGDIGTRRQNHAFWNGLRMLHAYDNDVLLRAESATLDVPPAAFNRSNPPLSPCNWLPSYIRCPLKWREQVPLN